MKEVMNIINSDIKYTLNDIIYNTFYIDNGFLLKFKSGDIKIKYDSDFDWVVYIDDYDERLEEEIDSIYDRLSNVIFNINENLSY